MANSTTTSFFIVASILVTVACDSNSASDDRTHAAPAGAALQLQVDGELQPASAGRVWIEVSDSARSAEWEEGPTRVSDAAGRRWLALSPHYLLPDRISGTTESAWSYYLPRATCVVEGISCRPAVKIRRVDRTDDSRGLWDSSPDEWLDAEIEIPRDNYTFTTERETVGERFRNLFAMTTVLLQVDEGSIEVSVFVQELESEWETAPTHREGTEREVVPID